MILLKSLFHIHTHESSINIERSLLILELYDHLHLLYEMMHKVFSIGVWLYEIL